ncbi:hypothetical protein N657DRAFT_657419 [Parathielavia appendiculata]|uniref:Uncharacterized protein n=1 Tax=Parathielavia appendiculata TaxID=2587402 RepID=A0AAN6Z1H4_9PEZI|nr:hypothetical protein N657DRAFT_657419 [Parathielavia appendiculata]
MRILDTCALLNSRLAHCIAIRIAALGSLVTGRLPAYAGCTEKAEAAVHANLDDPDSFVHHLKVVDPANEGDVMAYAKWELYPNGRSKESLEKLNELLSDEDKSVDRYGALREAAHERSEQGRNLYRHYGSRGMQTVVFKLEKYELSGVEKMTEMIRYPTASGKKTKPKAD